MDRPRPIALTEDEVLCVLAACCVGLSNPGSLVDREDEESLRQLRDGAVKIAASIGMSRDTLAEFAAYAAGGPPSWAVLRALGQSGETSQESA